MTQGQASCFDCWKEKEGVGSSEVWIFFCIRKCIKQQMAGKAARGGLEEWFWMVSGF